MAGQDDDALRARWHGTGDLARELAVRCRRDQRWQDAIRALPRVDEVALGRDLRRIDLGGANLRGAHLAGTSLAGADLRGADLRGADLRDSDLLGANLEDANLAQAGLRGARLSRAAMTGASLRDADLTEATLSDATLTRASLKDANLWCARADGALLSDALLDGAQCYRLNLTGATLHRADLSHAHLKEVVLDGAAMQGARLFAAELVQASLVQASLAAGDLTGADLTGANLSRANLFAAHLTGANMRRVVLTRAYLREAILTRADLSDAFGEDIDFTGAILDKADLSQAELPRARFAGVSMRESNLRQARLNYANLEDADLTEADAVGVHLIGVNASQATVRAADLRSARLQNSVWTHADLDRACLDGATIYGSTLFMARNWHTVQADEVNIAAEHDAPSLQSWADFIARASAIYGPTSVEMPAVRMPSGGFGQQVPAAGELFGRYRIERPLGHGGMGAVYQAFDPQMGRHVALKVVSSTVKGAYRDERMVRLRREARIAAALDSPFIVAIHDIGEHHGHPFLVMELIQGQPLSHYLGTSTPGCRRRITWLCQLASALSTIHRAGLIHRDIKPDNVIVHHSESLAKVLDFGIARRIVGDRPGDHGEETALLTAEGAVIGTPRYMSPEQIQALPVDSSSDQFSWGVVAYELLTGHAAWEGSMMEVLVRILTHEPPSLCEFNPDVPAAVDAAVRRALAKAPEDRFPSMDNVSAILAEHGDPDLFAGIARASGTTADNGVPDRLPGDVDGNRMPSKQDVTRTSDE